MATAMAQMPPSMAVHSIPDTNIGSSEKPIPRTPPSDDDEGWITEFRRNIRKNLEEQFLELSKQAKEEHERKLERVERERAGSELESWRRQLDADLHATILRIRKMLEKEENDLLEKERGLRKWSVGGGDSAVTEAILEEQEALLSQFAPKEQGERFWINSAQDKHPPTQPRSSMTTQSRSTTNGLSPPGAPSSTAKGNNTPVSMQSHTQAPGVSRASHSYSSSTATSSSPAPAVWIPPDMPSPPPPPPVKNHFDQPPRLPDLQRSPPSDSPSHNITRRTSGSSSAFDNMSTGKMAGVTASRPSQASVPMEQATYRLSQWLPDCVYEPHMIHSEPEDLTEDEEEEDGDESGEGEETEGEEGEEESDVDYRRRGRGIPAFHTKSSPRTIERPSRRGGRGGIQRGRGASYSSYNGGMGGPIPQESFPPASGSSMAHKLWRPSQENMQHSTTRPIPPSHIQQSPPPPPPPPPPPSMMPMSSSYGRQSYKRIPSFLSSSYTASAPPGDLMGAYAERERIMRQESERKWEGIENARAKTATASAQRFGQGSSSASASHSSASPFSMYSREYAQSKTLPIPSPSGGSAGKRTPEPSSYSGSVPGSGSTPSAASNFHDTTIWLPKEYSGQNNVNVRSASTSASTGVPLSRARNDGEPGRRDPPLPDSLPTSITSGSPGKEFYRARSPDRSMNMPSSTPPMSLRDSPQPSPRNFSQSARFAPDTPPWSTRSSPMMASAVPYDTRNRSSSPHEEEDSDRSPSVYPRTVPISRQSTEENISLSMRGDRFAPRHFSDVRRDVRRDEFVPGMRDEINRQPSWESDSHSDEAYDDIASSYKSSHIPKSASGFQQMQEELRKAADAIRQKQEALEQQQEELRKREETVARKEVEQRQKDEEQKKRAEEQKEKEREIERKKQAEFERKRREVEERKREEERKKREEERKKREEEIKDQEKLFQFFEAKKRQEERARQAQTSTGSPFSSASASFAGRATSTASSSASSTYSFSSFGSQYSSATSASGTAESARSPNTAGSQSRPSASPHHTNASSAKPTPFATRNASSSAGASANDSASKNRGPWPSSANTGTSSASSTAGANARKPSAGTGAGAGMNTGMKSGAGSYSYGPTSEAEWRKRQEEHARQQQEQFRRDSMRSEKEEAERAAAKLNPEQVRAAWAAYDSFWKSLKDSKDRSGKMYFRSFLWPLMRQPSKADAVTELTSKAIRAFLLSPCHSNEKSARDRLKDQMKIWHPDKFETIFLPLVDERDRDAVKEAAAVVSRALSELLTSESASSNGLFG